MMRCERCIVPMRRGVKSLRVSWREPMMDAGRYGVMSDIEGGRKVGGVRCCS